MFTLQLYCQTNKRAQHKLAVESVDNVSFEKIFWKTAD